ncbi:Riboflavin synthase alpha chain [Entophlyctis luteolus]|nr:Riboflavin synthase alpha chain [Entophlyctis luteolus]KAJ3386890.1 Riboflavin synthase alpha chain [Entophlyctis sp. JEL0112]
MPPRSSTKNTHDRAKPRKDQSSSAVPPPRPRQKKALGELLAELANPRPDSFDPEQHGADGLAQAAGSNSSDNDSGDDFGFVKDDSLAKAHYLPVGEGRIRKALEREFDDPKYVGTRVSRKDLGLSSDFGDADSNDSKDVEESDNDDEDNRDVNESEVSNDYEEEQEEESEESDTDGERESVETESSGEDKQGIAISLKRMTEKEAELLKNLAANGNNDVEKGIHVKNQMTMWETLLDMRISLQPVLNSANDLPLPKDLEFFLSPTTAPSSAAEKAREAMEAAKSLLLSLVSDLMATRVMLASLNKTVSLSPPTFIDDFMKAKPTGEHNGNENEYPHIGEDNRKIVRFDFSDEDLEEVWSKIHALDSAFNTGFRNLTIEKWSNKVTASNAATAGNGNSKKFTAINLSAMAQINTVLSDKERLLKRTRLVRNSDGAKRRRLGEIQKDETLSTQKVDQDGVLVEKSEREMIEELEEREQLKRRARQGVDTHLNNFDDEVFDDGDFYQQLLKELIEVRLLETDDPMELGMKWAELKQLQSKTKKKRDVDTKASKGRKIRYHIHEKLQNFMAPEPRGTWHEEMVTELFGSLFGNGPANDDVQGDSVEGADSGIIECKGRVCDIVQVDETWGGGAGLSVTVENAAPVLSDVHLGDSIAVNGSTVCVVMSFGLIKLTIDVSGICLTVTEFDEARSRFKVGIAPETVRRTNLGLWTVGTVVNLERAMNAATRYGGHVVQGHVDCTIELIEKRPDPPNSLVLTFQVPLDYPDDIDPLMFIVAKGYVCLNGTSLTVTNVNKRARTFSVMLIAHTQEHINLPFLDVGSKVNLEVDEIGKYVESIVRGFMEQAQTTSDSGSFGSILKKVVEEVVESKLKELK